VCETGYSEASNPPPGSSRLDRLSPPISDENCVISSVDVSKQDVATILNIFPNPVNEETLIQYHVGMQSTVRVDIVDISGRLVETLQDKEQNIGTYNIIYNTTALKQGVYYCTLKIGSLNATKKIIVL
jgi:hypothetical protein